MPPPLGEAVPSFPALIPQLKFDPLTFLLALFIPLERTLTSFSSQGSTPLIDPSASVTGLGQVDTLRIKEQRQNVWGRRQRPAPSQPPGPQSSNVILDLSQTRFRPGITDPIHLGATHTHLLTAGKRERTPQACNWEWL